MNRLDFSDEIARRVPIMIERDKEKWEQLEELRKQFVNDYTVSKINSLALQDYVIGSANKKSSFCYRIERELDGLGRIQGATAFKFGVYYGRVKGDGTGKKYRFVKKFGSNVEDAFETTKANICQLLSAASNDDLKSIKANKLSPMFKAKLLFLYYPERFVPIYSEEHLRIFASELNLVGPFRSDVEIQRGIAVFRAEWKILRDTFPILFGRLLYDLFWHKSATGSDAKDIKTLPLLEDAISGAVYITEMPVTPIEMHKEARQGTPGERKSNLENRQRIGDRGESIVLELERQRLIEAGRSDLSMKIDHVSQRDDSAGYDILSFEETGQARHIEVKSTSQENLSRGFYISENELNRARCLKNFYLYIVFSALSEQPRILRLGQPLFTGADFELTPVSFRVTPAPRPS